VGFPHGAACDVASEVDSRDDQHDDPEFARPHPAERAVGTFRQEWQEHERQDREVERGAHLHLADAPDEGVQRGLLAQGEHHDRGGAGRVGREPEARQGGHREHGQGGGLGGAIHLLGGSGGHDVGRHGECPAPSQERGRGTGVPTPEQEPGSAAQEPQQEKGADARETGRRPRRMTGPLPLDTDGEPDQAGHGQIERHLELRTDAGTLAVDSCGGRTTRRRVVPSTTRATFARFAGSAGGTRHSGGREAPEGKQGTRAAGTAERQLLPP
jgi:hypothetical protein